MTIHAKIEGALVTLDCEGVLADGDLDALFDAFAQARAKGPFVVVTDTTHMKSAPREVITAFAERLKALPSLAGTWLGDAVVIRAPAARFILSTLLVIAPLPAAVKVFEGLPAARRWCDEILRERNLPTPPRPVDAPAPGDGALSAAHR
jgi:hypothetical protein